MKEWNSSSVVDGELSEVIFKFREDRGWVASEALPYLGSDWMLVWEGIIIRRFSSGTVTSRLSLSLDRRRGHYLVLLGYRVTKWDQRWV